LSRRNAASESEPIAVYSPLILKKQGIGCRQFQTSGRSHRSYHPAFGMLISHQILTSLGLNSL
jgi:hypothetical protein